MGGKRTYLTVKDFDISTKFHFFVGDLTFLATSFALMLLFFKT